MMETGWKPVLRCRVNQFSFKRKYFEEREMGLVNGLAAPMTFVKAPAGAGATWSANAGFAQVSTRLVPMDPKVSGIGLSEDADGSTAAKDRPTRRSFTRISAPTLLAWRKEQEEMETAVCESLAVTPGSDSTAGVSHKGVVALSIA